MKGQVFSFMDKMPIAVIASSLLVAIGLGALVVQGLNYGVDFTGGAEIQIKFEAPVTPKEIRAALDTAGQSQSNVVRLGEQDQNEYLVRVPASEDNINQVTEKIESSLTQSFQSQNMTVRKTDIVGPKAGEQLRVSGFQALLWALLGIMVYIGLRFDFKYSPGAIVALFHDVIIILGIFALTGQQFTLEIVAALLAVIGYSVNDTVVVYDRVREHEKLYASRTMKQHLDFALNETLTRTLLTSTTTLLVSLTMYFFGGETIKDFFFAISIGVFVGTYSSLFVAAPVTLFFNRFKAKLA